MTTCQSQSDIQQQHFICAGKIFIPLTTLIDYSTHDIYKPVNSQETTIYTLIRINHYLFLVVYMNKQRSESVTEVLMYKRYFIFAKQLSISQTTHQYAQITADFPIASL